MEYTNSPFDRLIEDFVSWGERHADVLWAAVCGSVARDDHPADIWSDIDLWIVVNDPEPYRTSTRWLENFGNPILHFLETPFEGSIVIRTLYDNGICIDFAIDSASDFEEMATQHEIADLVNRGIKVILEKESRFTRILDSLPALPKMEQPSASELADKMNDFWFHALWTAKKLMRGELWTAKRCCDHYMKQILLTFIELEAKLKNGIAIDTWYNGRFFEQWADDDTQAETRKVFAHYDEADIWRALFETISLFRRVTLSVADGAELRYPTAAEEKISLMIENLYAEKK